MVFLGELLNYDIEKKKGDWRRQLQEVKVTVDGNEKVLLGDDRLWRDYRGQSYESHVRESLLMTFEKWLMDSINNHINKAKTTTAMPTAASPRSFCCKGDNSFFFISAVKALKPI